MFYTNTCSPVKGQIRVEIVTGTADILDEHGDRADVCLIQFRSFGSAAFSGPVATIRCHEDNVLVRKRAGEPGEGRVLVIDAGGSMRYALVGDSIAKLALEKAGRGSSSTAACATRVRSTASVWGSRPSGRTRDRAERKAQARSTFR